MKQRTILLLILAGVFTIFILVRILLLLSPIAERTITTQVKVGSYVGINLNNDSLYFGTVMPGGLGERSLKLQAPFNAYVIITVQGPAGPLVAPLINHFVMHEHATTNVLFRATIPDSTPTGVYNGTITLRFYKPAAKIFYG